MEEMAKKNEVGGNSLQLIARIVMIVAAIWLLVLKHKAKDGAKMKL